MLFHVQTRSWRQPRAEPEVTVASQPDATKASRGAAPPRQGATPGREERAARAPGGAVGSELGQVEWDFVEAKNNAGTWRPWDSHLAVHPVHVRLRHHVSEEEG